MITGVCIIDGIIVGLGVTLTIFAIITVGSWLNGWVIDLLVNRNRKRLKRAGKSYRTELGVYHHQGECIGGFYNDLEDEDLD